MIPVPRKPPASTNQTTDRNHPRHHEVYRQVRPWPINSESLSTPMSREWRAYTDATTSASIAADVGMEHAIDQLDTTIMNDLVDHLIRLENIGMEEHHRKIDVIRSGLSAAFALAMRTRSNSLSEWVRIPTTRTTPCSMRATTMPSASSPSSGKAHRGRGRASDRARRGPE